MYNSGFYERGRPSAAVACNVIMRAVAKNVRRWNTQRLSSALPGLRKRGKKKYSLTKSQYI